MTAEKLKRVVDGGMYDVEFDYQGKHGSISRFARDIVSICYDGNEKTCGSVDEAMEDAEIFGKSLNEIAEELDMYFDYD